MIKCLKQRGACLVAACFAMYAAQHISMMAWLPTYMRETTDASTLLAAAGCQRYSALSTPVELDVAWRWAADDKLVLAILLARLAWE